MNNDRELLELAGRAVGLAPTKHPCSSDLGLLIDAVPHNDYEQRFTLWNPLTSDGDRYHLAIKLKLFGSEQLQNWVSSYILEGFSYEEAWKWAIVRAAAEIGREMK